MQQAPWHHRGMENGPISPDGRNQWNGTEWIPIPPPPKRKGDTVYAVFIAFAIVLVAILIIGVWVGNS